MKYVLLRIEDDEEARQLLDDMSRFSGAPLRTPGGENEVYATVEGTGVHPGLAAFLAWLDADHPTRLADVEEVEPELVARLRRLLGTDHVNSVSGTVTGSLIQTGIVHGGVHLPR